MANFSLFFLNILTEEHKVYFTIIKLDSILDMF